MFIFEAMVYYGTWPSRQIWTAAVWEEQGLDCHTIYDDVGEQRASYRRRLLYESTGRVPSLLGSIEQVPMLATRVSYSCYSTIPQRNSCFTMAPFMSAEFHSFYTIALEKIML